MHKIREETTLKPVNYIYADASKTYWCADTTMHTGCVSERIASKLQAEGRNAFFQSATLAQDSFSTHALIRCNYAR